MSSFDAAKNGSFCLCLATVLVLLGQSDRTFGGVAEDDPSVKERLEFFENRIRTVLVDHCYKCHSKDLEEPAGGLRLDTRQGIRKGGLTGPAVVPGDPEESLLLSAIEYGTLQMPPDEKLSSEVVSDFRQWIRDGAHDSRDDARTAADDTGLGNTGPRDTVPDNADSAPDVAAKTVKFNHAAHTLTDAETVKPARATGQAGDVHSSVLRRPIVPIWILSTSPGACWPNRLAAGLMVGGQDLLTVETGDIVPI